jgi:hypothetical protein
MPTAPQVEALIARLGDLQLEPLDLRWIGRKILTNRRLSALLYGLARVPWRYLGGSI